MGAEIHRRKRKRRPELPDRQIARAFGFSAEDLAANRSGFMSLAQQWDIPASWQRWLPWLALPLAAMTSRREPVRELCGRAHLHYRQTQTFAFHRIDLREHFAVSFGSNQDETFRLTARQYRALSEGVPYRVYCAPDERIILSLERALNHCEERA